MREPTSNPDHKCLFGCPYNLSQRRSSALVKHGWPELLSARLHEGLRPEGCRIRFRRRYLVVILVSAAEPYVGLC